MTPIKYAIILIMVFLLALVLVVLVVLLSPCYVEFYLIAGV